MNLQSTIDLHCFIQKQGNEHCVKSEKGKNLGCYKSKGGAKKRLAQVEYFKHVKGAEEQVELEGTPIRHQTGKKTIEQVGTNFCVRSDSVDKNLGCYNSREQAERVARGGSFIDMDAGGPGSGRHCEICN